jgi:EmrB/QacA subfamily drug resistance transporter
MTSMRLDVGLHEPDIQRGSRAATVALTSVAFFMVALDLLVVITALPAMQRDLGASLSTLEWTINAYTLPYAAGIITAAALGDRLGRRRTFVAGLLLFTAASAACALAPSGELLIAARAVQGIGAALVMPLSLTILTAAFPAERRGAVIGIWGGIAGLAVASGPLVGGAVTEGLGWQWIFWLNVPIGLLAAFFARRRLAETFGPPTRLDIPGVALVTAGATGVVWGLVRATDVGWSSTEVIGAVALGILLLAGFLAWERRVSEPMLPLRLFANLGFAAAGTTTFLMIAALSAAAFLVTGFFQFAQGNSPFETGLRLLPWTGTPIIVAPLAGALSDRIGRRPVMAAGMMLQGAGLAWFAAVATAGASYPGLVPALVVAGVGVSMALPTTATAMVSAVSGEDTGKASGVNSTLQRFGSLFGIALTSAVFAAYGQLGSAASFAAGFQPALGAAAAFSLIGAGTALGVASRRRGDVVAAEPTVEPA